MFFKNDEIYLVAYDQNQFSRLLQKLKENNEFSLNEVKHVPYVIEQ